MLPPPPPPPPPSPDIIEEQLTITDDSCNNSRKYAAVSAIICIAGTLLTVVTVAMYLAHAAGSIHNSVYVVSGGAGSTPGKVVTKLKTNIKIEQLPQVQAKHNDAMAVWNGSQKIPLDWKVPGFSPRTTEGAELGSVNGQNARSRNSSWETKSDNNNTSNQQQSQSNGNIKKTKLLQFKLIKNGTQTIKDFNKEEVTHPLVLTHKQNGHNSSNKSSNSLSNESSTNSINISIIKASNHEANKNTNGNHPLVKNLGTNSVKSENNLTNIQPPKNTNRFNYKNHQSNNNSLVQKNNTHEKNTVRQKPYQQWIEDRNNNKEEYRKSNKKSDGNYPVISTPSTYREKNTFNHRHEPYNNNPRRKVQTNHESIKTTEKTHPLIPIKIKNSEVSHPLPSSNGHANKFGMLPKNLIIANPINKNMPFPPLISKKVRRKDHKTESPQEQISTSTERPTSERAACDSPYNDNLYENDNN